MDAAKKRELHEGMQDGIARGHGGYDLALTPLLFGLIGFWIDSKLGWIPLLTIVFTVVSFIGVILKTYFVYQFQMDLETKRRQSRAVALQARSNTGSKATS